MCGVRRILQHIWSITSVNLRIKIRFAKRKFACFLYAQMEAKKNETSMLSHKCLGGCRQIDVDFEGSKLKSFIFA